MAALESRYRMEQIVQLTALPEAFWWMVGAVAVYSHLEAGNIYNYVWWSSLVRPDLTGPMR